MDGRAADDRWANDQQTRFTGRRKRTARTAHKHRSIARVPRVASRAQRRVGARASHLCGAVALCLPLHAALLRIAIAHLAHAAARGAGAGENGEGKWRQSEIMASAGQHHQRRLLRARA